MNPRNTPVERQHLDDDLLAAACWCKAEIVAVPQADIAHCLTRSCGRPCCDDHDRNHRNAPRER